MRRQMVTTMYNKKSNYTMDNSPLQVVEQEGDMGVVVSAGDTLCLE